MDIGIGVAISGAAFSIAAIVTKWMSVKMGTDEYVRRDVCEATHVGIDRRLESIEKKLDILLKLN